MSIHSPGKGQQPKQASPSGARSSRADLPVAPSPHTHHCVAVSGVKKTRHDSRTEKNCRVVMMDAKTTAPKRLIVKLMTSCTIADAIDSATIHQSASGCRSKKLMGGTSCPEVTAAAKLSAVENMVVNSTWGYANAKGGVGSKKLMGGTSCPEVTAGRERWWETGSEQHVGTWRMQRAGSSGSGSKRRLERAYEVQ